MRPFLILAGLVLAGLAGVAAFAGLGVATAAVVFEAETGLIVMVDDEGAIRATGQVPTGFRIKELRKRIPELDLSAGVIDDGNGDPKEWDRALDALTIILPRLRVGETRISDQRISISGTLQPGFDAETTRAAIRLALGSAWEVKLEIREPPPPAILEFTKSAHGIEIDGMLPAGIEPTEAMALMGRRARVSRGGGLSGGGRGNTAAWRTALTGLSEIATLYAEAEGRISAGVIEIDGTLLPGYELDQLGAWLGRRLGVDWQANITGRETPAHEGDTRRDLATGEIARRRRGYWITEKDFQPRPDICTNQTNRAISGGNISFIVGKSQIDRSSRPLLDRLSSIAIRCLNDGGLKLEIGGHADAIGGDADNLALSQRRAMAVLLEFMDRGVRTDAMTATGHGETRPIADNATEAGRAQNRRISFDWTQ
jgi:OOP family OmpA-OmpF porin